MVATVLPPVPSATPRCNPTTPPRSGTADSGVSSPELTCKLSQLRQIQVDEARLRLDSALNGLRERHIRNEEYRQDALVKEQNRARRRLAKEERIRKRHTSATKIQALVRSYFVRRFVLPSVLEDKAMKELKKSRVALSETMLGLHQNIHDLAFLEQDRCKGATRIQAWWRAVLARRCVAILRTRHHIVTVARQMAEAATRLSSLVRGRQARMGCFRLRMEKEQREQKAKQAHQERMIRAIIKVQSHIRRRMAIHAMKARRNMLSKEIEGEATAGNNDHKTGNETTTRKSPERADRSRRKRNAALHQQPGGPGGGQGGGRHRRPHGSHSEGQTGVAFEDGGMMVGSDSGEQHTRRGSHKGPPVNRKKLHSRKTAKLDHA